MNLLELIPPTGASLLYLCKVADLFPIECRERLDQLEAQGKVRRIVCAGTTTWKPAKERKAAKRLNARKRR